MQFIPLYNMVRMLQMSAKPEENKTFINLSGTSQTLYRAAASSCYYNMAPFGEYDTGTPDFTYLYRTIKVYASSADDIPKNTTTILNQEGNTTVSYTHNLKGWTATITTTATEGTTIKAFFFTKGLIYNASVNFSEAVIYAVKLDNPVTIDSTGTASFTFAIEFD